MRRKTSLFLLTFLIVVLLAFATVVSNDILNGGTEHSSKISPIVADEISMIAPPISLEETGLLVSLEKAEQLLGVRLLPSSLPRGTTLYQVRVKRKTVTLFFR